MPRHLDGFVPGYQIEERSYKMSRLSGKVAVVTGASKGIGAGTRAGIRSRSAKVVVDISRSSWEKARIASFSKSPPRAAKAIAVHGDVAKADDVKRIFAETKSAFGALDRSRQQRGACSSLTRSRT